MKVLQVNCVYKKGSTGKIVYDIHKYLKEQGIESIVCYGRGQKENESNVYKTSNEYLAKFNNIKSRFTGLQYNGSSLATNKLISIIKKECPDVVHLHCINGFFVNIYRLLNYLKKKNIKTVLTLHAEFMHTANCGYAFECEKWKVGCGQCPRLKEATQSYLLDRTALSWKKMKKSFDKFDNLVIVSVSPWLEERAKASPILQDKKHCTILNGIQTEKIFYPKEYKHLIKKHALKDEKIILHVTANFNSEIKGGKYIIELAEKLKEDNIKIIIIGNTDKKIKLPTNIIDVGRVENQEELAEYYSLADLSVITSKRETFSMVCAESLSCGTPVVGFKAGAPEQIALSKYSEFVDYGEVEQLLNVVKDKIQYKAYLNKEIRKIAKEYYSKEKMCNDYIKLYER